MKPALPICCSTRAFQSLGRYVESIESPDALLGGAVAIASHAMEGVDAAGIDAALQHYADTVRSRVRGRQPQAVLAHLHGLLFDEEGFSGNNDDYYNVSNNFLPYVLETRRGLPITLSLIYKAVAARLGLRCYGVNLPGHFLVAVDIDGAPIFIDAFAHGRAISKEEAKQRLRHMLGDQIEWTDELLRPAPHRLWLTRMLQNLLNGYSSKGQHMEVAAILEMEMLLWPHETRLQRDLALVLARSGLAEPARQWLATYLNGNPNDPQTRDLRQLLESLTV